MTTPALDRRDLFRRGAAGAVGVAATSLTACAAAPAVAPAIGSAAGAVITSSWFSDMTSSLAAGLIQLTAEKALDPVWDAWNAGFQDKWGQQTDQGWKWLWGNLCADGVPPSVLFCVDKNESAFDPTSGRMIALVDSGSSCVVFEPWAWKALYLFVKDLTGEKDGDTLAGYQALCRISLLPSGAVQESDPSLSGRSELLGYATRNGTVEMNRRTEADGSTVVQVVATGIPSASDTATTREFTIPNAYFNS